MAGSLIVTPFATNGTTRNPPQTDPNGFVNWDQGYTQFYEIELGSNNPQAKAVERDIQNALFKIATENIQAWQQLGFSQWYSTMAGGYAKNAMVMRQDTNSDWIPFRSLVGANVSDPLTNNVNWDRIRTTDELLGRIPMPTGGPTNSAEVITNPVDFNILLNGTWEFISDAVASASPNAPSPLGGSTTAGMVEAKSWVNGATTYAVQRYLDRLGNCLFRGAVNGAWNAWTATKDPLPYSIDVSVTANVIEATFSMPSGIIPDNTLFWVKIANANTGATTFTPNIGVIPVALPVVGQANAALSGGELVVGGRALFIYKSDTNNFVLSFCSGGAVQVPAATAANHATNLGQVQTMVASAGASPALMYYMGQI